MRRPIAQAAGVDTLTPTLAQLAAAAVALGSRARRYVGAARLCWPLPGGLLWPPPAGGVSGTTLGWAGPGFHRGGAGRLGGRADPRGRRNPRAGQQLGRP